MAYSVIQEKLKAGKVVVLDRPMNTELVRGGIAAADSVLVVSITPDTMGHPRREGIPWLAVLRNA